MNNEKDEVERLINRLRFKLQLDINLGRISIAIIAFETFGLGFQLNLNWKTLVFNILVVNLLINW